MDWSTLLCAVPRLTPLAQGQLPTMQGLHVTGEQLLPIRMAHGAFPAGLVAILTTAACQRATPQGELAVFAASSLTHAFADLAKAFEATHPDTQVQLNFAGSQALRLQIEHGAQADVFASASHLHTRALVEQELAAKTHPYVTNALALVVPQTNPSQIKSFWDLPRAKRIVVGTAEVPIGAYTDALLRRAGALRGEDFRRAVEARFASRETNVRLVLAKVELGEADAAFVYTSDAMISQDTRTIPLPPELQKRVPYYIAQVRSPRPARHARAFIDLALSARGRAVLKRYGFEDAPP